jgi:hypothetical protein
MADLSQSQAVLAIGLASKWLTDGLRMAKQAVLVVMPLICGMGIW